MPTASRSSHSNKPPIKGLSPLNPHAAGIDIGAVEIFVSVPFDRDPQPVRSFASFTRDLHALARVRGTGQVCCCRVSQGLSSGSRRTATRIS